MSAVQVNAAVVENNTIVRAEVLTSAKAVKVKAIPGGKYILSEGEKGFAPENITLKRVGKDLHVVLEGADLEHPALIITDYYDNAGELVGKGEDGQWHEYTATSGEEGDEAAFLMDGESSAVALGAVEFPGAAGLNNLSMAGFMLSPALIALGALAALGAATGLGMLVGKHMAEKDNNNGNGNGGDNGNDYDDGSNGGPNIPTSIVVGSVRDQQGNVINPGDHSAEKSPIFTGTGKPGNKIEVTDGGKIIDELVIGDDGKWTWTPKPPLDDGEYDIVLVERDPITGKPSLPLPGFEMVVDTVAPGRAEIEDLHDEDGVSIINPPSFEIAGTFNAGEIYTNKNKPTLIGNAEANTFVDVYLNNVKVGEAEVGADGRWRYTFTNELADNRYSFHVVNRDKAGNTGLPSPTLSIIIDTQAPAEPVITAIEDSAGQPITGGSTPDGEPVFKGTADPSEAGAKIELRDQNDNLLGTAIVGTDGSWEVRVSPALAEAEYDIIAVIIDKAGNKTEMTTPVRLEVDQTAPELPGEGGVGLPGDVLEGAWDNVEPRTGWIDPTVPTNDPRPEFRGAGLESGDTVYIYDRSETPPLLIGTQVVGTDGTWSFEPTTDMGEGEKRIVIVVRDAANNESEPSDEFVFEIDLTAPADPSPGIGLGQPFEGAWDDQGDQTGWIADGTVTDDARPEFKGAGLNPGDIVVIYNGAVAMHSVVVEDDGSWTWTPELPLMNADYSISIAIRDAAGNESAKTDSLDFTLGAGGRPAVPGIDGIFNDDGDSLIPINNGYHTNDNTPLMKGTGVDGTVIIIRNGPGPDNIVGSATVTGGAWEWNPDPALDDGTYNLNATARTPAGNESGTTGDRQIIIDTEAPAAPGGIVLWDNVGTTGPVAAGGTTDDSTPQLRGTSPEIGAKVIIKNAAGTTIGTTYVRDDGSWQFDVPELRDGTHSLTAQVEDLAGNLGPASPAFEFVTDTSGVGVSITGMVGNANDDPLDVTNNGVVNDTTPTLKGTATPDSVVSIYIDGEFYTTTTSDRNGRWELQIELADGERGYVIHATVTGSTDPSNNFNVELDTTAPDGTFDSITDNVGNPSATPSMPVASGEYTNDRSPVMAGTAPTNTIVYIYDDARGLIGTEVAVNGTWSLSPGTPLNDGEYNLRVVFEDAVGNKSDASDPAWVIIVDATAPAEPVLEGIEDSSGQPITGGLTNEPSPVFKGTADPSEEGSLIELRDQNDRLIGSGVVQADGSWEAVVSPALTDGDYAITVGIKDPAGNTVTIPAPINLEIDQSEPTLPGDGGVGQPGDVLEGAWDNVEPRTGWIDPTVPTNDPRPEFRGAGLEPGDTVYIYDLSETPRLLIGTKVVGTDGTWSFEPTTDMGEGEKRIVIVVRDAANNESEPSDEFVFEIDLTAPADPSPGIGLGQPFEGAWDDQGDQTGWIADGTVTDDARPEFKGAGLNEGDIVVIYNGDVAMHSVIVRADGTWTWTPDLPLMNADYSISIAIRDAAGNESAKTDALDFTLGAGGRPAVPGIDGIFNDDGDTLIPINNGYHTNDNTPLMRGTGVDGTVIIIRNGPGPDNIVGSATVTGGAWEWNPDPALDDGTYNLNATARTPAGNESGTTGDRQIIIDTEAPAAPGGIVLWDNVGTTGPVAAGGTTDDSTPQLRGTSPEIGAKVIIKNAAGQTLGTTYVRDDGTWQYDVPELRDGTHSLTAQVEDQAGNLGPASPAFEFVTDTSGVGVSVTQLVGHANAEDLIVSNNGVVNDDTPTLKGTATPESVVSIYIDGEFYTTTTSDRNGRWELQIELADGERGYVIHATVAGSADPSNNFNVELDTTAPDGTFDSITDNVGNPSATPSMPVASGEYTNDRSPVMAGTAPTGTIVYIYDDVRGLIGSEVAVGGTWSLSPGTPLNDGEYNLRVVFEDAVGNKSRPSTPAWVIIVDATAPAEPVLEGIEDSSGQPITGGLTNEPSPVFKGTADASEEGSIIELRDAGGRLIGSGVVQADGSWEAVVSPALTEGDYAITVGIKDKAGNTVIIPAPVNLEIDLSEPELPGGGEVGMPGNALEGAWDNVDPRTGPISAGDVTNDPRPEFHGAGLEAGHTVYIYDLSQDPRQLIGTKVVGTDGTWRFEPTADMGPGEHRIAIIVRDPANNESALSDEFVFEIDTDAPDAPEVIGIEDSSGNPVTGGATNDKKPVIIGTGNPDDAGSIVEIRDEDGNVVGTGVVGGDGGWRAEVDPELDDGDYNLVVVIVDPAGNETEMEGAPIELEIDTEVPGVPEVIGIEDTDGNPLGNVTNVTNPVIVGTAPPEDAGLVVEIRKPDGSVVGSGVVGPDGGWEAPISPALTEGDYELIAVIKDPAGNETEMTGAPIDLEIDLTPPGEPEVIGIEDADGNTLGDVINVTKPVIVGTADPADEGMLVEIRDVDGTVLGTGRVEEDGSWRAPIDPELEEREYELVAVIVDPAGNEAPMTGAPIELEVDITVPEAPEVIGIESVGAEGGVTPLAVLELITNKPDPVIIGTAARSEAGSRVELRDTEGNVLGSGIVTGEGTWRAPIDPALRDGTYELVAVLIDRANNETPMRDTINLTIDTVAPVLPDGEIGPGNAFEGAWDDQGDRTGWIAESAVTDDARPEFRGAGLDAFVGDFVVIYNGDTVLTTVVIQSGGTWTWTPPADLPNASYDISIAIRDKAKNESERSDTLSFEINNGVALPAAPVVTGMFNNEGGSDVAITNGFTNDTTPAIRGTGVNGTIVTVYNGTTAIGSARVVGGVWEVIPDPALTEAVYTLTAKAANAAGNEGAASPAISLTVDTTVPTAPVITRIENDSGAEIIGSTTDRDPLFKGTADASEVGAKIELRDASDNLLGTGYVRGDGTWQVLVTPRLTANQSYNIKAVITDKAGNTTEMASGVNLRIDAIAPILPPIGEAGDGGFVGDRSSHDMAIYAFIGKLEKNKVYTSLGGASFISTGGVGAVESTSELTWNATWNIPDGWNKGVLRFSQGSKTEFHFNTDEQIKFNINIPGSPGRGFLSLFDGEGAFIERIEILSTGTRLQTVYPPAGGKIGKIVLEAYSGPIEMSNLTVSKASGMSAVKAGKEAFDAFSEGDIFSASKWHDLSSGLSVYSTAGASITADQQLNLSISNTKRVELKVGPAHYVTFYSDVAINDVKIQLVTDKNVMFDTIIGIKEGRNVLNAKSIEGLVIGRIIITGNSDVDINIDNLVWGNKPSTSINKPPSAIPLPVISPNTELLEDFNSYGHTFLPWEEAVTIDGHKRYLRYLSNGLVYESNHNPWVADSYKRLDIRMYDGPAPTLKFGTGASTIKFSATTNGGGGGNPQFRIYDIDGKVITTRSISGDNSWTSYTAPTGRVIGKIEFFGGGATIDNVTWTTPPAKSRSMADAIEDENSLLLNDEMVQLAKLGEEQQDEIIGTEGRIDILAVQGEDQLIDLTRLGEMVKSVEVIDLTGSGNNTLNISLGDILAQGGTNLFINDDTTQMMVKGNEGDVLNLSDLVEGADSGDWAKVEGTVQVSGVRYEVYKHSSLEAELLVQEGIQTNLLNN
ncbi:Ig-like domain-containing protein [Pantoea sp. USHLN256]|uniref:Ig-like domain-containing protein n=1 Tax=Pantoea sp. USHLN256 TaxID=3081293 RepID=UPI0030172858